MKIIDVRNVNGALYEGALYLAAEGSREGSRQGEVLVAPGPVMTTYQRPIERVLFSPDRDANPWFHLMEAIWIMAGHNDVEWIAQFNRRIREFAEDDGAIYGAYGWRWRFHHAIDQLLLLIDLLHEQPNTRRAVLAMWDPVTDLSMDMRDLPCNTQVYFDRRGQQLNMTVTNRSNDIFWGAYGTNAVAFSILQEYIAASLGIPVGVYRQFSNNYHAYLQKDGYPQLVKIIDTGPWDHYASHAVRPMKLVNDPELWLAEAEAFVEVGPEEIQFEEPFFAEVAVPMWYAWQERKSKTGDGLDCAKEISAEDWRRACTEWIERRA